MNMTMVGDSGLGLVQTIVRDELLRLPCPHGEDWAGPQGHSCFQQPLLHKKPKNKQTKGRAGLTPRALI